MFYNKAEVELESRLKKLRFPVRPRWAYLVAIALLISVGLGVYAYFMKESAPTIEEVKGKYEEQLMAIPNVNGVGIGEKEGRAVIVVFVVRKTPEIERVIPKMLEGYEVVVEEVGVITPLSYSP